MNIMDYIVGNALHLIPALYIVGIFLKNTPRVPDWLIPWILTLLGILGGCAVLGISYDGVLQGILASGAAVLGNQLIKQTCAKN